MHVTVHDQINAGPPRKSVVLDWRDGVPMRVVDLIRERVALELGKADALVVAEAGTDVDAAVEVALEGFRRNAFVVLFDDRQVMELDDAIVLTAGTSVTFIRLVQLVSG